MNIVKVEKRNYFRIKEDDLSDCSSNGYFQVGTSRDSFDVVVKLSKFLDRVEKGIGTETGEPNVAWQTRREISASSGLPDWIVEMSEYRVQYQDSRVQSWIFQGNPDSFEMDRYLFESEDSITWKVVNHKKDICVGDTVYLWRAQGKKNISITGIVARGVVSSDVFEGTADKNAKGYWIDDIDGSEIISMVQIKLLEVNLQNGMIKKSFLSNSEAFKESQIIKNPRGTTFLLDLEQEKLVSEYWASCIAWKSNDVSGNEGGNRKPRKKKEERTVIERSSWVVNKTIERAKRRCEVPNCRIPEITKSSGEVYVEVHHLHRLADGGPDIIDNTACLCPHHHKEIHHGENKNELLRVLKKIRESVA